ISAGCFLFMAGYPAAQQCLEISGAEEIRPALSYVNEHKQENDIILVYEGSANAFEYYRLQEGICIPSQVVTRPNIRQILEQLEQTGETQRLWILFSHVAFDHRLNERVFILERL